MTRSEVPRAHAHRRLTAHFCETPLPLSSAPAKKTLSQCLQAPQQHSCACLWPVMGQPPPCHTTTLWTHAMPFPTGHHACLARNGATFAPPPTP
jgi:hypothetical protein